jgi:hypothetical protein
MFEVKQIPDPQFPWGVFEAGQLVGRFASRDTAMSIMKGLQPSVMVGFTSQNKAQTA